jgi:asparagine synthetase B (glutamine-hydrolysing)
MYNQTTFMMMQVVVFFSGVIAGAGIFYFLQGKFALSIQKLLMNYSSEFQTQLAQNVDEIEEQFSEYKKYILKIASENAKEQKDIQDSFKLIDNSLSKFHTEIKSTHYVRQSLEDEITKLKNIIKRQNKHNKQKEQ